MSSIPVISSTTPLPLRQPDTSEVSKAKSQFSEMLSSNIDQVNKAMLEGNQAVEKLNTGEAKNLHEVMIATEEADLSLRMLVQFRNKAKQAYDEIMRMSI